MVAIARRRGLLCDELLAALADNSWEILDVSGSDVTDSSLIVTAQTCPRLQDVDIRCGEFQNLTFVQFDKRAASLVEILCHSLKCELLGCMDLMKQ